MYENLVLLAILINLVLTIFVFAVVLSIRRQLNSLGQLNDLIQSVTRPAKLEPEKTEQEQPKQEQMKVVSKMPVQPQPTPQSKPKAEPIEPEPQPEPEVFKCKKCQKEFADKKKLQRHIGMAHYKDLEI